MIKEISCCGCYFDKIYYILHSNHPINYETFNDGFDWIFTNLTVGNVMLICDKVFCEDLLTIDSQLFQFNLSK